MIGSEQLRVSSEASALDSAATTRAATTGLGAPSAHRLGDGRLRRTTASSGRGRDDRDQPVDPALTAASGSAELIGGTIVSVLTLGVMYAFNDAYDADADRRNPKKDQRQVSVYIDYRRTSYRILFAAKILIVVLAWMLLGPASAMATATVIAVNFIYSTALKGVPILDVGLVRRLGSGVCRRRPGVPQNS
jgi:hypothetical protein